MLRHFGCAPKSLAVSTVTVDGAALRSGKQPDLLKIDVEGYELKVLRGAQRTIETKKPILMLECFGDSRAEMVQLLRSLGYLLLNVDREGAHDLTGASNIVALRGRIDFAAI